MEQLIQKMTELATQYGPWVVDTTLNTTRMVGFANLFTGFLLLVVIGGLAILSYKIYVAGNLDKDDWGSWKEEYVGGLMLSGIVSVLIGLVTFAYLGNWWNWVAVFWPELYLAKRILGL